MKRGVYSAVLVAFVALATAVVAGATDYRGDSGSEVDPSFVAGKMSNKCDGGQKLDGSADGGPTGDIDDGTYVFKFDGEPGTITIDVQSTSAGSVFDFHTDNIQFHAVTSIYVKGGPAGSNLYNYAADNLNDVGADNGLHSPYNSNSGKWYGLSHICVFTDKL